MELTYSKMLDEVITNGYANKIADFLPNLVEDYDIQKSIHGDMYIHTIKYISTDMVKVFKNVISFDYNKWINRDIMTDIDVNVDISKQIKVLYTLLATGV